MKSLLQVNLVLMFLYVLGWKFLMKNACPPIMGIIIGIHSLEEWFFRYQLYINLFYRKSWGPLIVNIVVVGLRIFFYLYLIHSILDHVFVRYLCLTGPTIFIIAKFQHMLTRYWNHKLN